MRVLLETLPLSWPEIHFAIGFAPQLPGRQHVAIKRLVEGLIQDLFVATSTIDMLSPHTPPAVSSILGGAEGPSLPGALAEVVSSGNGRHRVVTTSIETSRIRTLKQLAGHSIRPVFIVSGGSGSGKSHMCRLLADGGYIQAERLITRPRRPCDPVHDRPFPDSEGYAADPVALSYSKHAGHYGIPVSALESLDTKAARPIFIAGDVGKISPFSRVLDLALPLLPVVNIRLEVPVAVMADRLANGRAEGFQGEALQRQKQNEALLSWELAQVRSLKDFFNMHVVMNLSTKEHEKLGYTETQLKPLDRELIESLLPRFERQAILRSSTLANDILVPRTLRGVYGAPAEVLEVLEHHIVPALQESRVDDFSIKGGLAVAIYIAPNNTTPPAELEDVNPLPLSVRPKRPSQPMDRPVSPDIDWAVGISPEERDRHQSLVTALTQKSTTFEDFWNKPIFNSNKAHGIVSTRSGHEVELDAIALSRVRPEGSPFCFEFPFDGYLAFRRRQVQLSNGASVSLVPPEMLIMEKLIAGRDSSLGKFDLFDAIAVLCTQPIDLQVITHMVESQTFGIDIDRSTLPTKPVAWTDVAQALRDCGIRNNRLRLALIERCVVNYEPFRGSTSSASSSHYNAVSPERPQDAKAVINFEWSPSTLKKMAFIDAALTSLETCIKKLSEEDAQEFAPLVVAIGREEALQRVVYLQKFLVYLASFQIGRPDVFIARDAFAASVKADTAH